MHQQPPTPKPADRGEKSPLSEPADPSADYYQYRDHLRQQNLTEAEIKQILLARIDLEYREMARQQTEEYQYWKAPSRDNLQMIQQELIWAAQKRDVLRELFGDSVVDDPAFEELFKPLNRKLGFLSSETQIALNELRLKSQAEISYGRGAIREFWQDRVTAAQTTLASIQELLTPDEFGEYQLRESRTAHMMRRAMDGFDYGEQEFDDIFDIRQSSGPDQVGLDFRDPQAREEIQSIRAQTNDRIREYLGEDRYRELARVQDPLYRSLQSIGDRYGNSEQEVIAVYDISTESRTKINEIRQNQSLSSQQRRVEIKTLNEQVLKDIEAVVGEEAAKSIESNAAQFRYGRYSRRGPGPR